MNLYDMVKILILIHRVWRLLSNIDYACSLLEAVWARETNDVDNYIRRTYYLKNNAIRTSIVAPRAVATIKLSLGITYKQIARVEILLSFENKICPYAILRYYIFIVFIFNVSCGHHCGQYVVIRRYQPTDQ